MIFSRNFIRHFHTLKYLKFRQTFGRFFAHQKRKLKLFSLPPIPEGLKANITTNKYLNHDPWNSREKLLSGQFTFLNVSKNPGWPPQWYDSDTSLLWQYNLHYFNYLFLLEDEEGIELCEDWIKMNPPGKSPGWDPYPLSLRIFNWCKVQFTNEKILNSLYLQGAYLYRNMEFYHPANHLLENAKALIFAGSYFKGKGESKKWFEKGLKILKREIPVQILEDGGYFERTTMYHSIMLNLFLDVYNVLPKSSPISELLKNTIKKMTSFLVGITHPGGEISLFNDSTIEISPSPKFIVDYSNRLIPQHIDNKKIFKDSGYFIHSTKDVYLIIDGGEIGPDYIPAHAHADIFSYELSVGENKVIVDSGVYEYPKGEMRDYVRSTRAHNTVMIDNKDQAECWDSFRVARRFKPVNVKFDSKVGFSKFEGCFKGYKKIIGDNIVHCRTITSMDDLRRIIIYDSIEGNGSHLSESFIHIHPDFQVSVDGSNIKVFNDKAELVIVAEEGDVELKDGWYCPQFGKKIKNKVISLSSAKLPAKLRYYIEY